ncbi:MAG: RIP metalloprotease RseP [candidate division WOR-3 bacterium]|nr:RIP metalloprotease RseP [candidate division WOR-3 bacterium]
MTFIVLIIVLGIMVLVHEAGHFIPAKIFNVDAPIFSIGFGKRLIGKTFRGTDYRISLFPFGGYVKMKGMDPGEYSGDKREFLSKPVWQRILIIFAGPFSNFILAFLIIYIVTVGFGTVNLPNAPLSDTRGSDAGALVQGDSIISVNNVQIDKFNDIYENIDWSRENEITVMRGSEEITLSITIEDPEEFALIPRIEPVIGKVIKGTPAEKSGIREGDKIIYIDSVRINDWRDISRELEGKYSEETEIVILRNEEMFPMSIVPEKMETMDNDTVAYRGYIGVEYVSMKEYPGLFEGVGMAWDRMAFLTVSIIKFIGMLFTGNMSMKMVGGPIAIYSMIGQNIQWGMDALLLFVSFFSLNLCIFNLIPFPPLDGSYILLYAVEGIFRKRATERFMLIYQQIGLIILIALIIFVTYNDVMRFIFK